MSARGKSSFVKLHVGVPVLDRISEAIRNGDEEKFRELISLFKFYEAANLNQLDSLGSHPLHEAVTFRRQKMLQTLLHYRNALRLDMNITNKHGQTALDIAVRNRNNQALKKLLKYDCSEEILEELREQLNGGRHCPLSSSQVDVEASCRSEIIMVRHRGNYNPYHPTEAKRSLTRARHLLHPISGTHWSGEVCKQAVLKCYHSLTKYMDPVYIIPLLVQAGHLNPDHVELILSCQTKPEQALQLLALLHRTRSGGAAYQGLFKALKDETEHEPHQELLQQLESTCESLVNYGYESGAQSQEPLEEVTTVYHGDDVSTPVLDRSIELSSRTESGVYSATPTAMQGTHSSGRMSTPSRRTSSQGSRRKSTSEVNPTVFLRGKINKRASANFRAPDEPQPRTTLHVINTVVKRDPVPVQETATESSIDSGACLVPGTSFPRVHPPDMQALLQSIPNTLDCVPFFIASGEQEEEEDDVEKDVPVAVPAVSSPKASAPIDIPSRNTSCASLSRSSTQDSAGSVSSKDGRSPRATVSIARQSSTDTTSSDTSSSSIITLEGVPTDPSTDIRSRWSLRKAIRGLVTRFSSIPNGTEMTHSTLSSRSGSGGPSYVMGCGIRM